MAATAEERIPALTRSEEIFSLAVPFAASSENRIGENALEGKKPHQGIFSRNRTIASGATWAKWPGTHQDSGQWWPKTVLGIVIDANGNTLSDPSGKSYTWDFENRLTQAVVPGTGTVNFKYDPFGRRIYKSSPTWTGIFVYDGDDLIETVNPSGTVVSRFTQGRGVDQPLSMLSSGTTAYYLSDGIRSITSLSNSAGALANTYTYDSFGNLTNSTGALRNPFQYTGREFDQETGAYYYRARYYAPQTGRFASEDPAKFFGGNNFYDYVLNDPTDLVDPTGKFSFYIHGNWCGPGWTGGQWESYDPAHDISGPSGPYYNGPIDYTDSVCRDHDMCYYGCRRDHKCNKGARRNCMRQCDYSLIYELTRFPWRYVGTVDAAAGILVTAGISADAYYPISTGPNDSTCTCAKQ